MFLFHDPHLRFKFLSYMITRHNMLKHNFVDSEFSQSLVALYTPLAGIPSFQPAHLIKLSVTAAGLIFLMTSSRFLIQQLHLVRI